MEMGAGDPAATRELFEERRAQSKADGGALKDDDRAVSLWTHYMFCSRSNTVALPTRCVFDAAVLCPRNAEVHAKCVLAEVRLSDSARAHSVRPCPRWLRTGGAARRCLLEVEVA
jgi:hypothetical protein